MVVALLALLVALGGTGYAALKLPKNSVGAKQLQEGAATGSKIKNDAITGADVKEAQLDRVPVAAQASSSAHLGGVAPGAYARKRDLQPGALHLVKSAAFCDSSPPSDTFCTGVPSPEADWQNAGPPYGAVGYWKDSGGWVHLQGEPAGGGNNTLIFFLAPGYRPLDATHEFPAFQCGAANVTYVDIRKDGGVVGGKVCVTLDGITFHP
jgi:hypothetical protein